MSPRPRDYRREHIISTQFAWEEVPKVPRYTGFLSGTRISCLFLRRCRAVEGKRGWREEEDGGGTRIETPVSSQLPADRPNCSARMSLRMSPVSLPVRTRLRDVIVLVYRACLLRLGCQADSPCECSQDCDTSTSIPHESMSSETEIDADSLTTRLVGHEAAALVGGQLDRNFLRVAAICLQQTVDGPLGASQAYLWREPLSRWFVPTEADKREVYRSTTQGRTKRFP